MKSIKTATPKKRGRPPKGKTPTCTLRVTGELLANVDDWAVGQDDQPGRAEAIRRLLEIRLKAKK
jgi:hypothetical protein